MLLRFKPGKRPTGEMGKHYYATTGKHWFSVKHWPSYGEWTLDVTALADDGETYDLSTMRCFSRETEEAIIELANDLNKFAQQEVK